MTVKGKSINLFLLDGEASGCIKYTLANWTGVAYKIPRTDLDKCKERRDLKQSGVYFLFGTDDKTGDDTVYIGQAGARKNGEGILGRLQEHRRNPDKDYWTEAVTFTTTNNTFGPTEMSYLENRFCNLAVEAKRYIVKNGNDPTPGNITEEKESELEEFVENAKLIMSAVGHKVFLPLIAVQRALEDITSPDMGEPTLYLKMTKANAQAKRTSDGFVVLKGSKLSENPTKSCPDNIVRLREKNANHIDANFILTEDTLFNSPSAAAGFVAYSSANGPLMWIAENGKSLKEIESKSE